MRSVRAYAAQPSKDYGIVTAYSWPRDPPKPPRGPRAANNLLSPRKRPSDPSRLLFLPENSAIWLAAIVGLSLSLAALLLIRQQLEAHEMLDFEWVAHNRIRALSHGLDNSMLAVTTLRDHVIASGGVDEEGFRVFAESLLDRYRGVQALMWVPLVDGSARDWFEAPSEQRKEGFQIKELSGHFLPVPAAERAEYFPVRHVGSAARRQHSFGLRSRLGTQARRDPIPRPRPWADGRQRAHRLSGAGGRRRVRLHGCQPLFGKERRSKGADRGPEVPADSSWDSSGSAI